MRGFPSRRAPLWFVGLLAALVAVLCRSVAPASLWESGAGAYDSAPQLGFWGFLIAVAEVLWKGVEVAAKVALNILQYSVHLLWRFATLIAKGVGQLGVYAWKGLRQAWGLLRLTYTKVLKPAWKFIWKWIDRTERWLNRTFGPLMKWLRRLRTWVLGFYATYVRPILDIIGIGRQVLRVLSSLGVDWARRLDKELADLQAAIDRPFRLLVARINEVINVVNRVVTADGLFQRLAHIRSIERDIREVSRAFTNWRSAPLTEADYLARRRRNGERTLEHVTRDAAAAFQDGGGRHGPAITEFATQWAKNISAR